MWKNLLLGTALATLTLVLAGCSTPHTLVFKDGTEIQTKDEPQLNEQSGFYEFADLNGKKHMVNKDEIRAVREAD